MRGVFEHFWRNMIKYLRSRIFLVSSLVMPAAWLVFVGLALPIQFTDNYLNFITPGILVMTMLATSISGGSLLVYDKMLGYMNKFLALPSPRESILTGKIIYILFKGVVQAFILIAFAVLLGATVFTPVTVTVTLVVLVSIGVLFASLGTTVGLLVDDLDNYAALNAAINVPLFLTSTALMPLSAMPWWLQSIAQVNPVSFAIEDLRAAYSGNFALMGTVVLVGCAVITMYVCMRVFRKVTVG
jgi:ABC-type polysaccharide/polyol phosphate export systems, permease component